MRLHILFDMITSSPRISVLLAATAFAAPSTPIGPVPLAAGPDQSDRLLIRTLHT